MAAALLGLAAVAGYAAKDDLTLASRADGVGGAKADGGSAYSSISADGTRVAFLSTATNLDPDDTDAELDAYVRDLQTNTVTLVSRTTGSEGAKANGQTSEASISADGRYVAFTSSAANLSADDVDGASGVFVRDLQENTTTLVGRAAGAIGAAANNGSVEPAISGDGRYVAFRSTATNLSPDDTDTRSDVFVRDLQENTTTLVSRATGPAGAKGNDLSARPSISADGGRVAFDSQAGNLDPADTGGVDVFVRDLQADTTTLVSRATGTDGAKANGGNANSDAISADGRHVAFRSNATNLHVDDGDSLFDVYVRDLQTDTTTFASRAGGSTGANADGNALRASISADGRYVAFESDATNLHPDDAGTVMDVFVRDLQTHATTLVSRAGGPTGANGDGNSGDPAISAGGRHVAFHSSATNLVPADTDPGGDVYVRDVLGGPPPAGTPGGRPPPGTPRACPAGTSATVTCVVDAKGRLAMTGTSADETFVGSSGRDRISPLGGNDVVNGNGGSDLISGGSGNDTLHGGAGNDRMNGNAGHDTITGDAGNDRIRGGAGNDRLSGNAGRDLLSAGAGNDRLDGGAGTDRLRCGTGNDRTTHTAADDVGRSCRSA